MRRRTADTAGSEDEKERARERRNKERKAEIPSSGFSLKPLVEVNEGCVQSSEADYITVALINGVSRRLCVPMLQHSFMRTVFSLFYLKIFRGIPQISLKHLDVKPKTPTWTAFETN